MNFALPVVIILTFSLSACGQKGPLYLPAEPELATTMEEVAVKEPLPTEALSEANQVQESELEPDSDNSAEEGVDE